MTQTATDRLSDPVDALGLGVFRAIFGAVVLISTVRFIAKGWVTKFYVEPSFHFSYWGFSWLEPLPLPWLGVQFGVMALSALALCLGYRPRPAAFVFFVCFTWAELSDKALYLNHYYLVSLLSLLLAFVPTDRAFAMRRVGPMTIPRGVVSFMRAQIALVYIYAGIAKINADWLLRGEPLTTWLFGRATLPIVGPVFAHPATGLFMSWAGMLYDLTIWAFLLWPKTRRLAFIAVLGFHLTVGALFPIGVFSLVMIACSTLFFAPDSARRWLPAGSAPSAAPQPLKRIAIVAASLWLAVQVVMPLRHFAYPGDANWTGEGFRFAWRVMLVEKTGNVEYRVIDDGREMRVFPSDELHPFQARTLPWEPDMILEYAHHLANEHGPRAAVYADAWVSLNGRPAQQLIDPTVDLAKESWALVPATWVLPHLD